MPRFLPAFGLRARLLLIIVLAFLPLSAYVFYNSYLSRQEKQRDIQEKITIFLGKLSDDADKPTSEIERSIVESKLPEEKVIFFFSDKGEILSYHPDTQFVGKNVANDPLIRTILSGRKPEGVLEGIDLNGVESLFAFTTLKAESGEKLYLVVGVPKELVDESVNRSLYQNLTVLAVSAVFSVTATWIVSDIFILRPVRTLASVAMNLRQGNLGARTGLSYNLGALGQLAQTFDQMAGALQEYTGQLEVKVAQRTKELEDANFKVASEKEEVEKQYQLMQVLIEGLPVGVFMIRVPSGEAFMANQRGYQILGISQAGAQKRNLLASTYSFLRLDGNPYPIELLPLNITIKEGRTETKNDVYIKKADGKLVNLRVSSSPVRDKNGNLTAAVMIFEEKV